MANPEPLQVPDDQRYLPRAARQFPFRWMNDAEREEVRRESGDAIAGMQRLIRKMVNRKLIRCSRADREDAEQDIRLKLLTHSLPRYDAWREPRCKVSTFLHRCICWHAVELADRHHRVARPGSLQVPANVPAPDTSCDRDIEALADQVLANPKCLGRHGPGLLSKPLGASDADTAATLGVTRHTVFLSRIRARRRAVELLHAA